MDAKYLCAAHFDEVSAITTVERTGSGPPILMRLTMLTRDAMSLLRAASLRTARETAHGLNDRTKRGWVEAGILPAELLPLGQRPKYSTDSRLRASLKSTGLGISGSTAQQAKLILKISRRDSRGRRAKKETPQEINSESVIGRAGGIELGGSIHSPRPILSNNTGLLGLIS